MSLSSSGIQSVIAVRIGPGQIAFTVMPSFPSSVAYERVSPTTPCFEEVYGLLPGIAPSPSVEAILMIRGESDSLK